MADPILAITLGDPAGIGPEIALKAAASLGHDLRRRGHSLLILGDPATLTVAAQSLDLPLPPFVALVLLPSPSSCGCRCCRGRTCSCCCCGGCCCLRLLYCCWRSPICAR